MSKDTDIYLPAKPGKLITAEDWNGLQQMIKADIQAKVEEGVEGHTSVEQAGNSDKLDGKTVDELTEEILEKAMAAIPERTGYQKLFKILKKVGEESIIEHGLKACPLVDVYQLDYFEVVCAADDDKVAQWVTFYLYHTSEKKLRNPDSNDKKYIEIEISDGQPYKFALSEMLDRYDVKYTDDSSLEDLETEFWKAFFADPNDEFDREQYCHSPWYEHCCREERTVGSLKKKGDWDDLWFQMRPRKTFNYPFINYNDDGADVAEFDKAFPSPAPTQIGVKHYDFDTLGVTLLANAVTQKDPTGASLGTNEAAALPLVPKHADGDHLKVMLLLKV